MQAAMSKSLHADDTPSQSTNLMAAITLVAVAGVAVSSVSLYEHFATSTTSFCNFSQSFNCDLVNRSQYSTVLGIPVALVGILGYVLLAVLATVYRKQAPTPVLLLIASVIGLGFALYLAYLEKFVLGVWCLLCLTSLALICIEAVLSTVCTMKTRQVRV